MKIARVKEILVSDLDNVLISTVAELREAKRIGIEALRVVNRYSYQQRAWEGRLLPGETID